LGGGGFFGSLNIIKCPILLGPGYVGNLGGIRDCNASAKQL